jgi:hypothetical protein
MKRYLLTCLIALMAFLSTIPNSFAKTFKSEPLSSQLMQAMRQGNTLTDNSPVPPARLRLLTISHFDFNGQEKIGHMVVMDVCEEAVLDIFKELYNHRFPIHQIKPMHYYGGDDHLAVTDNNTFSYVDRNVIGNDTKKSLHAYGLAIDINPVQNPFVTIDEATGLATYEPKAGIQYANRRLARLGKEPRKGMAEEVVDIFASHGFYWWGGYWDTPLDYQHFQVSKSMADLYVAMDPKLSVTTFKQAKKYYNLHKKPLEQELAQRLRDKHRIVEDLAACYKRDPKLLTKEIDEAIRSIPSK